jgi:hypothetical protein
MGDMLGIIGAAGGTSMAGGTGCGNMFAVVVVSGMVAGIGMELFEIESGNRWPAVGTPPMLGEALD